MFSRKDVRVINLIQVNMVLGPVANTKQRNAGKARRRADPIKY